MNEYERDPYEPEAKSNLHWVSAILIFLAIGVGVAV